MFGGSNSSVLSSPANQRRNNRLLSSAPYNAAASRRHSRIQQHHQQSVNSSAMAASATSSANTSMLDTSNASGISSSAKIILETLEKMSTPIRDAQKIPVPSSSSSSSPSTNALMARAERRRAILDELSGRTSSSSAPSSLRKRPRLGTPGGGGGGGMLNGPPIRTIFNPVPARSPLKSSSSLTTSSHTRSKRSPPRTSTTTSTATTSGSTTLFSVQQQPLPEPSSPSTGKIRAKVGEKAKLRAEKALADDEPAAGRTPDYLSNAVSSVNPFLGMNSMPKFQFKSPAETSAAKSIPVVEAGQKVLTGHKLNAANADTPEKMQTPSSFGKAKQAVETTEIPSQPQKPPQIHHHPQQKQPSFEFRPPTGLAGLTAKLSSSTSSDATFNFRSPARLEGQKTPNKSSVVSSDLPTVVNNGGSGMKFFSPSTVARPKSNLPDLTSITSSTPPPASSLSSSASLSSPANRDQSTIGLFGMAAAKQLKTGSVMDILGGSPGKETPFIDL